MVTTSLGSSNSYNEDPDGILQLAQTNKDAILLLEAAALLSELFKFSDDFLKTKAANPNALPRPTNILLTVDQLIGLTNTIIDIKSFPISKSKKRDITLKPIDLMREPKSLGITNIGNPPKPLNQSSEQIASLIRKQLHFSAHYEKEESDVTSSFYRASVFGIENPSDLLSSTQLTSLLVNLPLDKIIEVIGIGRRNWYFKVKEYLQKGVSDTRRSTNEVTLWDWGIVTANMCKAVLPYVWKNAIPTIPNSNEIDLSQINFRILSIGIDVLALFNGVDKLADVLGLQSSLNKGFEKSRELLEETYPLANRIYHDTTGSYFLFPDFDLPTKLEKELRQAFAPDIPLWISLSSEKINTDTLNPIRDLVAALDETKKMLAHPRSNTIANCGAIVPDLQNTAWSKAWEKVSLQNRQVDRCPVTKYYPVGYDEFGNFHDKALKRKISAVALNRRAGRVKNWLQYHLSETIWLDEVASDNGKNVLIAASFNLEGWLDGTLQSSLIANVGPVLNKDGSLSRPSMTPKFPSPARINRVWETLREFWSLQQKKLVNSVGRIQERLEIAVGGNSVVNGQSSLHSSYSYDAKLKNVQFSLVYDEVRQKLIMVNNLNYLAKLLGKLPTNNESGADFVAEQLRKQATTGLLLSEEGIASVIIKDYKVELVTYDYLPAINILSEPNLFMIIVPSDKAVEVVEQVNSTYNEQFSKVQNRLPLHLNLVFFDRRTPLYAVIDTARRMLDRPIPTELYTLSSKPLLQNNEAELRLCRKDNSNGGILSLELTTKVSYRLGDGSPDFYYPYFFAEQKGKTTSDFSSRSHHFQSIISGYGQKDMVHVSELEQGDEIYFMPSSFDFEYLDVTARRYEVNYDGRGGRRLNRPTKPFYLQDIEHFKELWNLLSNNNGLTNTQLTQIGSLIAEKRYLWQKFSAADSETLLREFAKQTFARAFKDPKFDNTILLEWAVNGRLDDLLELYTRILKYDTEKTTQLKESSSLIDK
jgi:hypothetical protein